MPEKRQQAMRTILLPYQLSIHLVYLSGTIRSFPYQQHMYIVGTSLL